MEPAKPAAKKADADAWDALRYEKELDQWLVEGEESIQDGQIEGLCCCQGSVYTRNEKQDPKH